MSQRLKADLDVDMARLRRMLEKAVGKGGANPDREFLDRLARQERHRILDLACGACNEANTLTDFLSDLSEAGSEKRVELTGIDVRAREIADASRRFQTSSVAGRDMREFEFLNGDATQLDQHRELGDDFDLVFLRHQNFWNGERTWEEIFDHALTRLGDDGRLVITSYFDREHQLALEAIERLGGELISTEANPESRSLPTSGKSVDRHLAIFRKKLG
ncbi:MAG: class I SAM-dependent methyltransferase [Verrucomicrobiota bacterium]